MSEWGLCGVETRDCTCSRGNDAQTSENVKGTVKGPISTTGVTDGHYKSGSEDEDGKACRKRNMKGEVGPLRMSVEDRR